MITQRIRVDVPAARDNQDGTITARVFPLTIAPRYDAQFDAFRIDRIEINPATAVMELQFIRANGFTEIFSTFGKGMTALGDLVENEVMTLAIINLSIDSGVSVAVWIDQYQYQEARP